MMGTLAMVMAKKKIRSSADLYQAIVTADIEDVDGVLKITRIHVHYDLKLPPGKREAAEAAFSSYLHLCPAAQSVLGSIQVTHELQLADMPQ